VLAIRARRAYAGAIQVRAVRGQVSATAAGEARHDPEASLPHLYAIAAGALRGSTRFRSWYRATRLGQTLGLQLEKEKSRTDAVYSWAATEVKSVWHTSSPAGHARASHRPLGLQAEWGVAVGDQ
jgi:hypothetical protein